MVPDDASGRIVPRKETLAILSRSLYLRMCSCILKEHINSHVCLNTPTFCSLISAIRRKTVKYLLAGKARAENWLTVVSHMGTNFLQMAECSKYHVFYVCL